MFKKLKINQSRIVLVIALAGLVLPFAYSLITFARLAGSSLAFRYPLDYGEGPLLDQALRLASGENIYHNDFSVPPFTISNYPPVFPLLQVPFALVFGPAFWYGRLISILGALLTALLIGLTLYKLTGDIVSAAVAGLIFLSFPYVQFWSVLNRVDLLALVLSWAALLVVVCWPDRRWGIPLTAGLLVLSIFTRQSYALAAPLGAFVWLLAERRWRKAVQLALITGGAGLALFLLINLFTRGGFFLNIVTANVNPFYWDNVRNNFKDLADHSIILFVLIGIFLLVERFRGRTCSWPLVLPYLIAAGVSGITIGKDGSSVNYLLELSAALSFAAGAAMAWLGRNTWVKALVAAALCIQVSGLASWVQHDYVHRVMERVVQEEEVVALFNIVRETDGIVLADEFMGLVPIAGKRLYFQPFEFKMLAEGGIWDEQDFLVSIADHKFALILWYAPPDWPAIESRWTPRQREMIQGYYGWSVIHVYTQVLKPK